jgi:nucleoside-diphosphate-sugar epimerase
LLEYADNASNGIETDCVAKFRLLRGGAAVPARVELSRTRKLRNSIRIEGSRGVLEWMFGERSRLLVDQGRRFVDRGAARPVVTEARWGDEIEQPGFEGFRAQIDDWLQAIDGAGAPELSGESVVPTVQLIEECYERRVPLEEPWFTEALPRAPVAEPAAGAKRRVLVTGASGFIGCRLVERLHFGSSWQPRALIRNPGRAVRLARMPIEFAIGDLASPSDLAKALEGCEAVVHGGIGTSWRRSERVATNVEGTRNLVNAALRAGVKRFVHISTIAVYGNRVTGTITEETPPNPQKGWDYGESKYAAEQIVLEAAARGLPAIVLRVAVVYGPHNMTVVTRPLQHLVQNRLFLVDCGNTPSNTIYIDNLCEGIRLALDAPAAVNGETFVLSDDDGYTWGEYFGYFADALGARVQHIAKNLSSEAIVQPPTSALKRWYGSTRDLLTSSEAKGLAKRIYLSEPWGTPARWFIDTYPAAAHALAARIRSPEPFVYRPKPGPEGLPVFKVDPITARVSTGKAERILGFHPLVSRRRAMELTLAWARDARIVPSPAHEEIAAAL